MGVFGGSALVDIDFHNPQPPFGGRYGLNLSIQERTAQDIKRGQEGRERGVKRGQEGRVVVLFFPEAFSIFGLLRQHLLNLGIRNKPELTWEH